MNMHQPLDTALRRDRWAEWTRPVDGRGRRRRLIIIAAVALIAAVGAYLLLSGGGADTTDAAKQTDIPAITVVVPGQATVTDTVSVTGSIAALRDMPVGVQGEGGAVTAVLVDAGDRVRDGQVLARIDRSVQAQEVSQLQAALRQARADAELAQSELDRAQALVSRGFISKADIDRKTAARDGANAKVAMAAAQLKESQARLARLDVRAPEAGLVLERNVEPGQVVGAGSGALFRIAKDGVFELRAKVAEQDLVGLKVGMKAEVRPVGQNQVVEGTVWQLSPTVDPQSRQGIARIRLEPSEDIRPGGFAQADIKAGQVSAPVLPESAVLSDAQGNYVYVVDGANKVVRRDVKLGMVSSQGIAIASGLTGQEKVVLSAGAFLHPGEQVSPKVQQSK